jgi:hypothetical protein
VDVVGHLDLCGPNLVEGWIYSAQQSTGKIRLQVFLDGILQGECVADQLRVDLREAGMGDGHCAFSFAIPTKSKTVDFRSVRLRIAGSVLYMLPDEYTTYAEVERARPIKVGAI